MYTKQNFYLIFHTIYFNSTVYFEVYFSPENITIIFLYFRFINFNLKNKNGLK